MRKLVELNPSTMYANEIDTIRLKREAEDLKKYILAISANDKFEIRAKVLPIVEAAINGTRRFPINTDEEPLKYEVREGLVPDDFHELYARFFNTAIGARVDLTNIQENGGKFYAWMDFLENSK